MMESIHRSSKAWGFTLATIESACYGLNQSGSAGGDGFVYALYRIIGILLVLGAVLLILQQ